MEHRSRAGESAEAGFTFVELVVALTILAVGIVGVIGVTNSSFRVAGGSSGRSKMVAIATKEIEALRAIPYNELKADCGNPLTPCHTVSTGTSGGLTYEVEKAITFPSATAADQHPSAVVAIRWSDQSGTHEVHQSTYLYPGGVGPKNSAAVVADGGSSCTPPRPTSLTASQVADLTQITSTVDLAWVTSASTCETASYVIRYYAGTSSIVNELTRLATATTYRVTGLTAGTAYRFQVAAKSSGGQMSSWSDVASVTTAASLGTTCNIGTITLTPPAMNKKSNGTGAGLRDPVSIRVPVSGSCPGFNIVYRPTATTTQTLTLTVGSDGAYTGTLNHNLTWDVGRRYVDVRKTGQTVNSGAVLLTVCEHNVSNCS